GGRDNRGVGAPGRAEALGLAGRLDEAAALAEEALELARKHQERGNEALALRLLGELAVRRTPGDAGAARQHYDRAAQIAAELGMEPLRMSCQAARASAGPGGWSRCAWPARSPAVRWKRGCSRTAFTR